jgi:hypothetical protein
LASSIPYFMFASEGMLLHIGALVNYVVPLGCPSL